MVIEVTVPKHDCQYFIKDCFNTFSLVQLLIDKEYVALDDIPSSISLESVTLDDTSLPFFVKFSLRRMPKLFSKLKPQVQKFLGLKLKADD
jgi:hypothetical protein